jgi:hypothetical protein
MTDVGELTAGSVRGLLALKTLLALKVTVSLNGSLVGAAELLVGADVGSRMPQRMLDNPLKMSVAEVDAAELLAGRNCRLTQSRRWLEGVRRQVETLRARSILAGAIVSVASDAIGGALRRGADVPGARSTIRVASSQVASTGRQWQLVF